MFRFTSENIPRIKEIHALAKVCGCKACPACTQWKMVWNSLLEPNNLSVLIALLDIPKEVFRNRGS